METASGVSMSGVVKTSFGRWMAKVLVFLMAIQVWPLWELSRSYEINEEELGRAVRDIAGVAEVWAASPVSDAGAPQTLKKRQPVGSMGVLNGAGSYDQDGDPLTYQWYGPFGLAFGVSPLINIPEGFYQVSLLVHDGTSFSGVSTVSMEVSPCFNILARSKYGKVQVTWTHLVGTMRYDIYRAHESNPNIFMKIGETTSTYSTYLDETVLSENTYLYVVGANIGGVWCYSNVVSSHPTTSRLLLNYAPLIYSWPVTQGWVGILYNYDVNATDPNSDGLTYRLISGPSGMGMNASTGLISWVPSGVGSFGVTVEASDGKGKVATQSFTIQVGEIPVPNRLPVADAGPDQTVFVTQTVQLDGSKSSDPDGDTLTYQWSFFSLPAGSQAVLSNSTSVNPTFVVDKPGTYEIQLIVNDGKSNSFPDVVTINTENSRPVANAGPDQTVFVTQTVTLDGSKSSDVDGDALTYQWSFLSLPAGSQAVLSNSTVVNPTFVVDKLGAYEIQLIVNDGKLIRLIVYNIIP